MYVDTAYDVMRLLALPLEKLEGDTVTIAGHNLKVVKAKMATSTKLYAVNSKAKPMLDAITAHGHPAPLPSDLGLEDVEQFVQQRPAGTAREYFELSSGAGEENDDTNVALIAQILDIKLDEDFRVTPYAKYKHVMAVSRHHIGVESKMLADHIAVKR